MNFGAIDIGSNAARVLIMEVIPHHDNLHFNKLKLLRYPLGLGYDAFLKGEISSLKADKLIKMCQVFKLLMDLYDVQDSIAFATSAMRNSSNGQELVHRVKETTGINIEIIDGNREANILYESHFAEQVNPNRNYIYVDVGGGSTEIALFLKNGALVSKSFPIGTIRLLHKLAGKSAMKEMEEWIKKYTNGKLFWGIGSGGNINTLFSLSGKAKQCPITLSYIKKKRKEFKQYTIEELRDMYSFKLDRAKVIVPALTIYRNSFRAAKAHQIFVPKIGLADGMIRLIAEKYMGKRDEIYTKS